MARQIITGDKELERALSRLADKSADRVARSAIGGGLTVLAQGIRKAAPVGKTKSLKKSIGSRFTRAKGKHQPSAKAGINVGKQKKTAEGFKKRVNAPHAHLVGLGTTRRTRTRLGGKFAAIRNPSSRQLSTGTMPSNPFVKQAVLAARPKLMARMKERAAKALAREVAKVKQ